MNRTTAKLFSNFMGNRLVVELCDGETNKIIWPQKVSWSL